MYLKKVLEEVAFPYYDSLKGAKKREFIYIEEGAKVHKGKAPL